MGKKSPLKTPVKGPPQMGRGKKPLFFFMMCVFLCFLPSPPNPLPQPFFPPLPGFFFFFKKSNRGTKKVLPPPPPPSILKKKRFFEGPPPPPFFLKTFVKKQKPNFDQKGGFFFVPLPGLCRDFFKTPKKPIPLSKKKKHGEPKPRLWKPTPAHWPQAPTPLFLVFFYFFNRFFFFLSFLLCESPNLFFPP